MFEILGHLLYYWSVILTFASNWLGTAAAVGVFETLQLQSLTSSISHFSPDIFYTGICIRNDPWLEFGIEIYIIN